MYIHVRPFSTGGAAIRRTSQSHRQPFQAAPEYMATRSGIRGLERSCPTAGYQTGAGIQLISLSVGARTKLGSSTDNTTFISISANLNPMQARLPPRKVIVDRAKNQSTQKSLCSRCLTYFLPQLVDRPQSRSLAAAIANVPASIPSRLHPRTCCSLRHRR